MVFMITFEPIMVNSLSLIIKGIGLLSFVLTAFDFI